jgi:DNA-binding NtrC family response regulator
MAHKISIGIAVVRSVLLVSREKVSELLLQRLQLSGWRVMQCCGRLDAVNEVFKPCKIGVVWFDDFDPALISVWEDLSRQYFDIEWIALVNKALLAEARFKDLILNGFYDFHTLPIDYDRLQVTLGHAYGVAQLKSRHDKRSKLQINDGLVGESKSIEHLRKLIRKAAAADSPVLICGESGTGKELVASSIHAQSALRKNPFVAVNCASLPGSLIHSELFGHEKGAFTGANTQRIGRIESAAGGDLFLDEIGDLNLDLQVNLLRFLQEKTISRVGGKEEIPVDARVIAATHVNLEQAIALGAFREDLYYRLNVIRINIPPLRERRDDIEHLAQHFFEKFRAGMPSQLVGFSTEALQTLRRHDWPGNVRELVNRIRQALVMSEGKLITSEDLGLKRDSAICYMHDLETARAEAERKAILEMTAYTKRNMTEAARRLGVTRATLYRLIYKHKLASNFGLVDLQSDKTDASVPGTWSKNGSTNGPENSLAVALPRPQPMQSNLMNMG